VTVQVWVIVAMVSRCDDTKRTASICVRMRYSCFDALCHGYLTTTNGSSVLSLPLCASRLSPSLSQQHRRAPLLRRHHCYAARWKESARGNCFPQHLCRFCPLFPRSNRITATRQDPSRAKLPQVPTKRKKKERFRKTQIKQVSSLLADERVTDQS
jgi:hypothetical protein